MLSTRILAAASNCPASSASISCLPASTIEPRCALISLASARSSSDWDGFELFHQFVDPGAVRLDDLVVALGERAIAMHIRFQSHLLALERALIDLVDVGNREQVLRIQLLHSRVRMAECAQAHTTNDQQRDRENA